MSWIHGRGALPGLLLLLGVIGCGDTTAGTGDRGRVVYELDTHYLSKSSSLKEVDILTGYAQTIRTRLTQEGARAVESPATLTHRVKPSQGVELEVVEDGYDVQDVRIRVSVPGDYSLETRQGGALFDRISLQFDKPESLEVITWVRRSMDSAFGQVGSEGRIQVDEGTQVTVIPVPKGAEGKRILGDFEAEITGSPSWAVVAARNIMGVYEQWVWSSGEPVNLVFIEPGEVEVKVRDAVNDVERTLLFTVAESERRPASP